MGARLARADHRHDDRGDRRGAVRVTCADKQVIQKNDVLDVVRSQDEGVLLTIGAGDIDRLVTPIHELLTINQR